MSANYEGAIKKAHTILEENYVSTPPVVIDEIARNYGLKIYEIDFENDSDVAGFIDPKTRTIYVNKDDSDTRKAFTIAHELGHWILHRDKLEQSPEKYAVLYRKPIGGEKDDVEKEANCFAAHLLVPRKLLDEFRSENDNVIASIFGVSPELIGYRKEQEYEWRKAT